MTLCFQDESVRRVVVEPDVRNEKIAQLNAAAGFVVAAGSSCRQDRGALVLHPRGVRCLLTRKDVMNTLTRDAAQLRHLTPELMDRAQRALVVKAISEFAHERLLPRRSRTIGYVLPAPSRRTPSRRGSTRCTTGSSTRTRSPERSAGRRAPLDAQAFVAEFSGSLGIPQQLLPTYLEEIAGTLASSAWKLAPDCLRR